MSWYKSLKNGAIGTIGGGLLGGPMGAQLGGLGGVLSGSDSPKVQGALSSAKNWLIGGSATKGLDSQGANGAYAQGYLRDQLGGVNGRMAPQLASGPQDQVRAQQMQQAGYLQSVLGGQQRGAGEIAVNRQVGQANAAQQAAMHAARGAGAALAARNAMRNQADIGLAGAGQAAQAQLADQQMASGQLAGLLGQTRDGDLRFAGANLQSQLQQTGMNDSASQGYLAQLLGMDQAAWQREMQKRQLAAQDKGMLPGLMQMGGTALGYMAGGPPGGAAGGAAGRTVGGGGAAPSGDGGGLGGYIQSWIPQGMGTGTPNPYGWTSEHG